MKILAVITIPGSRFRSNWKSKVQVIETSKGEFIDQAVERDFTRYHSNNPGYDWASRIGETLDKSEYKIVKSQGFKYLKNRGV